LIKRSKICLFGSQIVSTHYAIYSLFLVDGSSEIAYWLSQQQGTTIMSLETLIVSVGVLGSLQAAWLVLKNLEARTVNGTPAYVPSDESDFVVESKTDRAARRMKKDFDLARAKSIMGMVGEFGQAPMKI
jgi:hypothetical protein